jgi:hypothetical protein
LNILTSYSQPSAVAERTKVSPYPVIWVDSLLRELFVPTGTSSTTASTTETKHGPGTPVGAIVGGVVGGVAVIIIVIVVIFVTRKKRSSNFTTEKECLQTTELHGSCLPDELDGNPRRNELSGSSRYVFELHGI